MRQVSIGSAAGRAFTGLPGNGVLAANGDANTASWPGADSAGAGFRGGGWGRAATGVRVLSRACAAQVFAQRSEDCGGRAARSASSGVD